MGDFNLVLNPEVDRADGKTYYPNSTARLNTIIEELELLDPWRIINPNKRRYSWHRQKSTSRIDYALMDQSMVNRVTHTDYKPRYKTDHSIFEITLSYGDETRGPVYWKFNTKLLKDHHFVQQVNDIIDKTMEIKNKNPHEKWEILKENVKILAVERSKDLVRERRAMFNKLMEIASRYEEVVDQNTQNAHNYAEYLNVKMQLADMIQEQTDSAMFRSKCSTILKYEKSNKYFFSLEKTRYNRKVMRKIINDKGEIVTDPKAILAELEKYYSSLYSHDNNVKFELQNDSGIVVSNDERIMLEQGNYVR